MVGARWALWPAPLGIPTPRDLSTPRVSPKQLSQATAPLPEPQSRQSNTSQKSVCGGWWAEEREGGRGLEFFRRCVGMRLPDCKKNVENKSHIYGGAERLVGSVSLNPHCCPVWLLFLLMSNVVTQQGEVRCSYLCVFVCVCTPVRVSVPMSVCVFKSWGGLMWTHSLLDYSRVNSVGTPGGSTGPPPLASHCTWVWCARAAISGVPGPGWRSHAPCNSGRHEATPRKTRGAKSHLVETLQA